MSSTSDGARPSPPTRALWLTADATLLREQLRGASPPLTHQDPPALAFGVNTDAMISGAACTLGYTPEVLGPHFLVDFLEIVELDAVRQSAFDVIVAGDAYGSGSSREAAVVAHQGAGIRLVVARSFQRIFQENLVYCGLPFTTDLAVLEAPDPVAAAVDHQRATLPPLFAAIAEAGGLLAFADTLAEAPQHPSPTTSPGPMTCVEKIIATQIWPPQQPCPAIEPGQQWLCRVGFRGMHEYTGGMVMALYRGRWGDAPLDRPESVAAFEDHFVLLDAPEVPRSIRDQRLASAHRLRDEMLAACTAHGIGVHGPGRALPPGVCHRIVVESYASPGDIIVLTDSHTPTAGVLNAFAFGIGSTAMAFALRTGLVPVTVPLTVRVWITGAPPLGLSPKDVILFLIGDPYFREERWRTSATDTCVLQFGGPGLERWSIDELSVLTNMTVEGGLMTGIIEPSPTLAAFLRTQGRPVPDSAWVSPDPDARYTKTIELDLATVPLTVATPGDSRNRMALQALGNVPIHNVVIGSCTGGSLADLRAAAEVLRGRTLAPGVRMTVTPSSQGVWDAAEAEGYLALFRTLGAVVTAPGCGACIGNGPGIPAPGETTASTTNRNFARRMGAPGDVYLVSPAVAAASAVAGRLLDPREFD